MLVNVKWQLIQNLNLNKLKHFHTALFIKMSRILYLQPDECVEELYASAAAAYNAKKYEDRDAGFDLFVSTNMHLEATKTIKIGSGIRCGFFDNSVKNGIFRAYYLYPRSSLSKTPMRLANSVGIIDATYRGELLAAVDMRENFTINHGDRYFQITAPDLLPFDEIKVVKEIPGGPTIRGEGGFGSTGVSTMTHIFDTTTIDTKNIHAC